jgi:hypothetical protein
VGRAGESSVFAQAGMDDEGSKVGGRIIRSEERRDHARNAEFI